MSINLLNQKNKRKTYVAFDFDGTLTKKDSFVEFVKFTHGKTAFYLALPYIAFLWFFAKLNIVKLDKAKALVFSYFYKKMPIKKFDLYCENFKNQIDTILKANAKTTINNALKNADNVMIISASVENWILPWANQNNIKTVISTKIEVNEDDILTGNFSTKVCNHKEKVNRLLNDFPNIKNHHITVYGNSKGDKPLMSIANNTFYKTLN